jgi:hypothetical protein
MNVYKKNLRKAKLKFTFVPLKDERKSKKSTEFTYNHWLYAKKRRGWRSKHNSK